jgi:hypothetical protein
MLLFPHLWRELMREIRENISEYPLFEMLETRIVSDYFSFVTFVYMWNPSLTQNSFMFHMHKLRGFFTIFLIIL